MPIVVMGSAFLFNGVNAYLDDRYILTFSAGYNNQWLVACVSQLVLSYSPSVSS